MKIVYWSIDDDEQLMRRALRGDSMREIVADLGRSIDSGYKRREQLVGNGVWGDFDALKKMKRRRQWTRYEFEEAKRLRRHGLTFAQIAAEHLTWRSAEAIAEKLAGVTAPHGNYNYKLGCVDFPKEESAATVLGCRVRVYADTATEAQSFLDAMQKAIADRPWSNRSRLQSLEMVGAA